MHRVPGTMGATLAREAIAEDECYPHHEDADHLSNEWEGNGSSP